MIARNIWLKLILRYLLCPAIILSLVTCGKEQQEEVQPNPARQIELSQNERLLFDGESLAGWEVTNFGPQGPVRVNNGAIRLVVGDGCTGVTYQGEFPKSDYEVRLQAQRVSGRDFFCGMTFPVGDEFCTFIVGGWGGSVVGISSIDGLDASENFTSQIMVFESERWYDIRVRVTSDSIRAWIDQERVVSVGRAGHTFSVRNEVKLSRPFGICSWRTTAAIRNIVLQHPISRQD